MLRRLIIAISALLVVLIAAAAVHLVWLRGPLAGDWRHDFGDVIIPPGGVTLEHSFTLRNRTSHDIAIRKVSPGCGCTKALISSESIAPGGTVTIEVSFSLLGRGKKHANIVLDLGEDGTKTLTVAANRIRAPGAAPVEIEPPTALPAESAELAETDQAVESDPNADPGQ